MKRKSSKLPKRAPDDLSVSLGVFDGADLRLTSQNTLFVEYKGQTIWPYLRGETVCFETPTIDTEFFKLPEKATDRVKAILKKKEEIRKQHALDFDEDEAVYTYS